MNKRKIVALIITMSLMMSMLLASCGSKEPPTLESYISNNEQAQEQINKTADEAGLEVAITGNDVIYTFDLTKVDGVTEEIAKSEAMTESLDAALVKTAEKFSGLCAKLEEESKLEGVQILVNYSYDGDVIVSKTFNSSGIVE